MGWALKLRRPSWFMCCRCMLVRLRSEDRLFPVPVRITSGISEVRVESIEKCSVPGSFENENLLICIIYNTYKRKSIRVFRRPMLVYFDVCGVEIPLLSTVSIPNCKYQEECVEWQFPNIWPFSRILFSTRSWFLPKWKCFEFELFFWFVYISLCPLHIQHFCKNSLFLVIQVLTFDKNAWAGVRGKGLGGSGNARKGMFFSLFMSSLMQ